MIILPTKIENSISLADDSADEKIVQILTKYFIFRNIQLTKENLGAIFLSLKQFAEKYRVVKVYDLFLALKNYGDNSENNISASYVLDCLKKHMRSEERKAINKPKEEVKPMEISPYESGLELLKIYQFNFNRHGIVNTGMSAKQLEAIDHLLPQVTEELENKAIEFYTAELIRKIELTVDRMEGKLLRAKLDSAMDGIFGYGEKERIIKEYRFMQYFKNSKQ